MTSRPGQPGQPEQSTRSAGSAHSAGSARSAGSAGRISPAATAIVAAVLLNAALAFEIWWPTPAIRPLAQLAPEFVGLWLLILAGAGRWPGRPRLLLPALALGYLLLVVGRYVDVASPALYGRTFNWYWDGSHLPALAASYAASQPLATTLALLAALGLIGLGLAWGLAALIGRLAAVAPAARRSPTIWALTAAACLLSTARLAGLPLADGWVARPVLPGWYEQARLVRYALSPATLDQELPPSPRFDSDLALAADTDVVILFIESYGAAVLDDKALADGLEPARLALADAIDAAGLSAVSARVRSPTFGGASWLAHAALLTGIDTRDPGRYPLILASDRDNLVSHFRRHGHRALGLMPGLSASWPEGSFYGFDRLLDGPALDYRGPAFGLWQIPDQYAIDRLDRDEAAAVAAGETRPRLVFFATISSHFPFKPLAPIVNDWSRLADPEAWSGLEAASRPAPEASLGEAYVASIGYTFDWLGQWLARPAPRERIVVVAGDHQPLARVAGRAASWDVPVHLIAANPVLLKRLLGGGFQPGLKPADETIGDFPWLLRHLLDAFDSRGPAPMTGADSSHP